MPSHRLPPQSRLIQRYLAFDLNAATTAEVFYLTTFRIDLFHSFLFFFFLSFLAKLGPVHYRSHVVSPIYSTSQYQPLPVLNSPLFSVLSRRPPRDIHQYVSCLAAWQAAFNIASTAAPVSYPCTNSSQPRTDRMASLGSNGHLDLTPGRARASTRQGAAGAAQRKCRELKVAPGLMNMDRTTRLSSTTANFCSVVSCVVSVYRAYQSRLNTAVSFVSFFIAHTYAMTFHPFSSKTLASPCSSALCQAVINTCPTTSPLN